MHLTSCLLAFSMLALIHCNEQELDFCMSDTLGEPVSDLDGVIYYNDFVSQFVIVVSFDGTFDKQHVYVPCELAEEYQVDGRKVIFSGREINYPTEIVAFAGQSFFRLNISEISIVNDE